MPQLDKKINLYGLTMIAIGSCIGAGIFVTPYEVVKAVPHHGLVLLIWVLGGVIALTGALTFAELGGMFPKAGGVYVFLKEAYGDLAGFLYGWVILLVVNTGSLAALGIAFAEYMTFFVDLPEIGKTILAVSVVGGLTLINAIGIHVSQWLANVFTGLKLLAMLAIVAVGIIYYDPTTIHFSLLSNEVPTNLFSALLLGLIGVLWSFGGWHHASYLAGETIDAPRTVPRAMILGTMVVTIIYVLINLAYMLLLPLPAIQATTRVAGDAVATVIPFGGQLVAIAIAISIFGTISIYTTSAPRIYFAMAKDKIFFPQLAHLHPRFHTPTTAMGVQAIWAILLLIFWGTFENLIAYVTFMDIAFMTLAGASIFLFRKRLAHVERPYQTTGYPFIPLIFIGISGAFVLSTLVQRPIQAVAGLAFGGLGIVVYYWLKNRK